MNARTHVAVPKAVKRRSRIDITSIPADDLRTIANLLATVSSEIKRVCNEASGRESTSSSLDSSVNKFVVALRNEYEIRQGP